MASESTEDSLPPGTKPLSHQVAGHRRGSERARTGFLETSDGVILKPLQSPPRDGRELGFYEEVFEPSASDPVVLALRKLLPSYLGLFTSAATPDVRYLRLEDLTKSYQCPSIIDFKVGRRRYDPKATPEKIRREKSLNSSLEQIGFQIRGARVYSSKGQTYVWHQKEELRDLREETMLEKGLRMMYADSNGGLRDEVVKCVLDKLYCFDDWFAKQTRWAFYGSSLLVVYEGMQESQINHVIGGLQGYERHGRCADRFHEEKCGRHTKDGVHIEERCSPHKDGFHVNKCRNGHADGFEMEESGFPFKHDTSPNKFDFITGCHIIRSQSSSNNHGQDLGICAENYETRHQEHGTRLQCSYKRTGRRHHSPPSDLVYTNGGPTTYLTDINPSQVSPCGIASHSINTTLADVRLIDFAHVFPSQSIDENFIYGLRRLIRYHETLLTREAT